MAIVSSTKVALSYRLQLIWNPLVTLADWSLPLFLLSRSALHLTVVTYPQFPFPCRTSSSPERGPGARLHCRSSLRVKQKQQISNKRKFHLTILLKTIPKSGSFDFIPDFTSFIFFSHRHLIPLQT